MYKIILSPLSSLLLLTGCGSMFDLAGKGKLDRKIYYDVNTNKIIDTYESAIKFIDIQKNRDHVTHPPVRIKFDEPVSTFILPLLKDSIAFYNFRVDIYIEGEHGRLQHHIKITKKLVKKKQKIYSRYINH